MEEKAFFRECGEQRGVLFESHVEADRKIAKMY